MPTDAEKQAAVARIKAYSREYRGKHRAFFDRLLEALEDFAGGTTEGDHESRLDAQYRTAVSMLLALADRPNVETLQTALARINQRAGSNFTDVQIVGGARHGELLSHMLRRKPDRSKVRAEILAKLRNSLMSDYQPFRQRRG
jgi:hypothetical protein